MTTLEQSTIRNGRNGRNGRTMMIGVVLTSLVLIFGAFGAGYAFFANNFVSRREFDEVRAEQAKRTPIVHGISVELTEIKRRLANIEEILLRERPRR